MTSSQASKPRIILLCGAPKTGTTSLAYYFRDNEATLTASGYYFPHRFIRRGDVDPLYPALRNSRRPKFSATAVKDARDRLASIFQMPGRHGILMSYESILGEPFEAWSRDFYPIARRVAPVLAHIFEGYDVHVRFFVRNFADFIPSYYIQTIRRGEYFSLAQFYRSIDRKSLSWCKPIQALEEAFGAENTQIYDYADFKSSPTQTIKKAFGQAMGVDLAPFDPALYYKNRSIGGIQLYLARYSNQLMAKMIPDDRLRYSNLLGRYLLAPSRYLFLNSKPALASAVVGELNEIFRQDKILLSL